MNQPSMRVMSKAYMLAHAGECVKISDDGLSFEAVECGSSSYKSFVALLNQSGTDAPVATILANTLGFTPVWIRDGGQGQYYASGAFVENKCTVFLTPNGAWNGNIRSVTADFVFGDENYPPAILYFITNNAAGSSVDDWGDCIPIEIRVYP